MANQNTPQQNQNQSSQQRNPGKESGTDFGLVGFQKQKTAARFLAFPKSLKRFEGKRIIGIDWALVQS